MKKEHSINHSHLLNIIISWYEVNKRDLPWRRNPTPYHIWLSEIILQQTRVKQGLPYYEAFVQTFPTIDDLAKANEQQVLRLWQGLGYYSRARNLHKCAKVIVSDYNSIFPETYEELQKLPGIGKYTAAAIASIAFDKPVPVIDGNVYRVLSRIFGISNDISDNKTFKVFFELSKGVMNGQNPSAFNQGLMEFGALQCSPGSPGCFVCPASDFCFAFKHSKQTEFPVKTKKVKVRKRYFNYFIIQDGKDIYLKKRSSKDIWQGLYDFALIESDVEDLEDILGGNAELKQLLVNGAIIERESAWHKHILTHQRLFIRFFHIKLTNKKADTATLEGGLLTKFTLDEVAELPKPILIDKYLKAEFF